MNWEKLCAVAAAEVEGTLEALPEAVAGAGKKTARDV